MIQEIDSWVSEDERRFLLDYVRTNQDTVTHRNTKILKDIGCSHILAPKIHALCGDCYVSCWAKVLKKGEDLEPHNHATDDAHIFSGTLFLTGPDIGTSFTSKTYKNKEGTLMYFPSTVVHWVEPNPSDEIRVSMSFDFLFNRNISPEMNKFLVEIKAEKGHLFKAAW